MKPFIVASVLLACVAARADAAVVSAIALACKNPDDSKKGEDYRAKKDILGFNKFSAAKIASGDCVSLARSVTVNVDQTRSPLVCVRLPGGLDCYWVSEAAINRNPGPPPPRVTRGGPGTLLF